MHRAPAAMVTKPVDVEIRTPRDPNTLSNYHNFVTKHTSVDFEIDFEHKILSGAVGLDLESLTDESVKEIILDSSFLDISEVKVDGKTAKFEVGDRIEPYGAPLRISLTESVPKGKIVSLVIAVSTTEKCTALQWLTPAQTSNGKHPFMFSQCQAIHARSVFPCQDTPDVKSTFSFSLRSHLPVLASGLPTGASDYQPPKKDGEQGTLKYTFEQKVPINSYLFAVASGDVACASVGPRSTVWTGPEELLDCQRELDGEIEPFMKAIESTVAPDYQWTQYNILILPPSFPYGGMENPVWTYATPSIISGDKQNIDVIAHELSHSWSGNLVSCASWEHFWLNEGWTTYLERRIQAYIHGEPHRHFSAIIGWKALEESIERYGTDHEYTKLITNLKGQDPDDAFSSVPYEKGFHALYQFELLLTKEKWDKFIPHYFSTFANKSLDSYDFKACLIDFFAPDAEASKKLADFDWDRLFYAPGYPPKPEFDDSLVKTCYELADKWEARVSSKNSGGFKPQASDIDGWVSNQSVVFIERLQSFGTSFSASDIQLLGETYGYNKTANIEVSSRYLCLGLKAKAPETYKPAAELLGKIGRMKFVRPLFRLLNEADRKLAVETFEKNKDFYHPICRQMVEKDLFGDESNPIAIPTPSKEPIRIVCVSDAHTACPALPSGDILIHAGDLTNNGTFPKLQRQLNWLSSRPHPHKLAIAGNHDLLLDPSCYDKHKDVFAPPYAWQRKTDLQWGDIKHLASSTRTLRVRGRSLNAYGNPHTPKQGNWAFQYPEDATPRDRIAELVWSLSIPNETHVLVTHGPARGHVDSSGSGSGSPGCKALLQELWRTKPRLHIHAHIHRGRGTEVLDWGVVQWCYDQIHISGTGVYGAVLLFVMVAVWVWEWRLYFLYGTRRSGRSVVVNAAWEGNEEGGVTVVEI